MKNFAIAVLLVLAVAAALWKTHAMGEVSGKAQCQAKQAKDGKAGRAKQKAVTQADINRSAEKGAQLERNKAALDDFFNNLEMEQEHAKADPVDSCVLPAERLRIWRDANAGRPYQGAAISESDRATEASAPASNGRDQGLGGQPSDGGQDVSPARVPDVPATGLSGNQP